MNKTTRRSQARSNNSNSIFYADRPKWIEASSSEEEEVGIRKGRRKNNVYNTNKGVKG